jgi:hypothetical protein
VVAIAVTSVFTKRFVLQEQCTLIVTNALIIMNAKDGITPCQFSWEIPAPMLVHIGLLLEYTVFFLS